MMTDCPNCSSLLEGEIAPGARVVCPFCGETFEVCTSPFDQLRMFMETHWPPPEHGGPFCEGEAPRKNYTGWIIHRLREDNPEAVIDLMSAISPGCRTRAAEKVNTLWKFDFTPYLKVDPETLEEIRALWLRVRFNNYARSEAKNIACLLRLSMWTRKIELTPDWLDKAHDLLEKERQNLDPDGEELDPVSEQDLMMTEPQGNPLYDWAAQAPLAIRERLTAALRMCGYDSSGGNRPPNSYQFKLDRAYEWRWGADFGYASRYLLDSNTFCGPCPETYEKLFSREELSAFLTERGIPSKSSCSRKRMLDMLLSLPDGPAWFEQKIKEQQYVRLQPTLSGCLDAIPGLFHGCRLFDAVGMIPVPGNPD